jgi:hypothetical protein
MKPKAVHEEVPKEAAAVKSSGALKKQHGDRHLTVGCCKKLKRRTQGNRGSRSKLAAARRGMTRCAGVAQCKGQLMDDVAKGTPKGWTFGKKRRPKPE